MKVLMLGKIGLLDGMGGDKIQITNTARELRNLGVEVDVKDGLNFNPAKYDVVHIFQLDWTPESNIYAGKAKKAGKPVVFSPIHHSVDELKKFDDEYVFDFRRLSKILFSDQFKRDTFKDFYRVFFDFRRSKPVFLSITRGLKNLHTETLNLADIILVQTEAEAEDIKQTFGIDIKWRRVLNGVSQNFLHNENYENKLGISDYIICVGRIEPRKNQLKIIEAVKKFREQTQEKPALVLIGKKSDWKHFEYHYYFEKSLKKYDWIKHVEKVPYEDMPSYYHFAKVGVSASWFETTGLTSLEALFCGANAVASGERAKEYLGDLATYCKPDNVESIYEAVKKEYFSPKPKISEKMRNEYTWKNAAKKTLEVYEEALNK